MSIEVALDRSASYRDADADLDGLAEAIKAAWQAGDHPDALKVLAAYPDLAADRDAAVDLAYAEYCLREKRGETLDPEGFCAAFPHRDALAEVLTLHTLFQNHPGILERVTRPWPKPGDRFGDFVLIGELGRGASARVYLGRELTAGGRPVALKIADHGAGDADLLGPLSHPHVIPVLSSPRIPQWTALVMPFLGAATLRTVLEAAWLEDRKCPSTGQTILDAMAAAMPSGVSPAAAPEFPLRPDMSYEDAIRTIGAGVFSGLAYLHDRGLAHRDLKPSNVLLAPTGHPYLLDLNLAIAGQVSAEAAGTPAYMSPEQLRLMADPAGPQPADWRPADLFSAGVMLYELVTGRHPYAADLAGPGHQDPRDVATELLSRQAQIRVSGMVKLNPRVSRPLIAAIERCLNPDPAQRPTAQEVAALLAPALPRRRRLLAAAMIALAAVSAVVPAIRQSPAPVHQPIAAPATPADSMERGLMLFRQGENGYKLAALEFMKAGDEHQDGRAYAFAAYCFALAKDHSGAIRASDKAERLGFVSPEVHANRAYSLSRLEKYTEAVSECDKALALQPELRAARFTRAFACLKLLLFQDQTQELKVPDGIIHDIEIVTSGSPNTPDMWLTAALIYGLEGQRRSDLKAKAIAAVQEAIHEGMSPASLKRNRILAANLGDFPEFQQALKLTPGKAPQPHPLPLVNPDSSLLVTISRP